MSQEDCCLYSQTHTHTNSEREKQVLIGVSNLPLHYRLTLAACKTASDLGFYFLTSVPLRSLGM